MRINEVLALRADDLDFERKILHVRHSAHNGTPGTPKSEASKASLPMPDILDKRIKTFMKSKHYPKNDLGLLFCNRKMRPHSDNKLREKYLRPLLVSLKINRPGVKFHAFRHAVASELIEAGTPITVVRDQLRHSDVLVTLTERATRASDRRLLKGSRPMTRVGRAVEKGESRGFMKVLVDADSKEILGGTILRTGGDETIHCVLDMMDARAPYTVMQRAMHIHPTVSELIPTILGELQPL
jgi:Phage integrase family/Pyridine nucleotide-disulphide oxidoreductase, dimerisation domain